MHYLKVSKSKKVEDDEEPDQVHHHTHHHYHHKGEGVMYSGIAERMKSFAALTTAEELLGAVKEEYRELQEAHSAEDHHRVKKELEDLVAASLCALDKLFDYKG